MGPETAMWLVPSLLGGMGAVGSALGSGAEGKLKGYGAGETAPSRQSIDPSLLGQVLAPIEQAIGIAMGRMRQPVTLPGAFVQPNPMYSGGGLPMSIGTTGVDPALQQPHLMGLPGVNTGAGQLSRDFAPFIRQPGSGAHVPSQSPWGTIDQPAAQMPEAGGGMPQMQGALEMLGVHSDPMGNLSTGGQGIFTGAGRDSLPPVCDPETERWDEQRQTCVSIVLDRRSDPTDDPGSGDDYHETQCQKNDGYWCADTRTCVNDPSQCAG